MCHDWGYSAVVGHPVSVQRHPVAGSHSVSSSRYSAAGAQAHSVILEIFYLQVNGISLDISLISFLTITNVSTFGAVLSPVVIQWQLEIFSCPRSVWRHSATGYTIHRVRLELFKENSEGNGTPLHQVGTFLSVNTKGTDWSTQSSVYSNMRKTNFTSFFQAIMWVRLFLKDYSSEVQALKTDYGLF